MTCWYTITSPENTRIRFWIDDFGVNRFPSGSSQTRFTVGFYDGFQETSKLFHYINSNKPTDISYHSLSDVLGIKLVATKGYVTYTGLLIRYQAVPSCGDNILAISESQSISSPGYPKQHMTNEICTWVVTSPVNHVVEVTAEYISNETCCDKVTVKAATLASTTQLQTDQVYTSPGRIITINFLSNNSIQRTGFYLSFRAVDICGIKSFVAKTDIEENFKTPGYPGDYGSSMTCWYTITSPENTRIRFWIDSFGVTRFPSGNGQTYFTISFYDGFSSSDERIDYINRKTSTNIMSHSKSNILGIKIVVHKAYVTYTGLSVRYMAVDSCGNDINAMDQPQNLSSPNYPEKHAINEICTWVITSPINHVVELKAENISDESCCENVTVKVPSSEATTQLQTNQVYTSPGRSVKIDYISHNSSKRAGFQLLFTAENICGKTNFMANIDVIAKYKFPAYPGNYWSTITCWYSIASDKDTRIRFWIDDFGVKSFPNDYYGRYSRDKYGIGFYNGFSETSPRFLYIYTQRSKELMYHTKSNILGIKLIADRGYVTYTGMSIRYTSVASCGNDFHAIKQPQMISSPNYPEKHLTNEICTWMITSPTNHVIKIEVKNISSETCCDKVQVKVATPAATTQLSTNQVYTSPGRVATIDFISYNSSQRSGFNLTYKAVHICGTRRFFAEIDVESTLHAPGYPGDYGVSMTCWYTITSSKNTVIRLWINNFGVYQFPSGSSRSHFTVYLYSVFGSRTERITYFGVSSRIGTMYHSKSNVLRMSVNVDKRYDTYSGISVRFMAVASCRDNFKATQQLQQLSTPGYPRIHLTNEICYWMISSPHNHVIQMNIKNVSDETCCDKITIKVPSPLRTNSIRTPQVYTTPGRTASITFISHNSSKRVGFNMEFKAVHVCGSIQLFAQLNIESTYKAPGYPIDYGSILTCWYTITSPENTRIRFQVTSFGVVGKTYRYRRYTYQTRIYPRWQYFDVGFYNGFSDSSERFRLVKADNQENKIHYSKSNVLGIKLSAQRSYVTYSGITLKFIAVGTCGTNLMATYIPQTINFAGTNFPNMSNVECEWDIQAPCDDVIKLRVYNVSDDSSKDQLKVTSPYTSTLTNNEIFTTSHTFVRLKFVSNGNPQRTKFNIQYRTTRICGSQNMIAEYGKEKTIVELGFPTDLTKTMDCWYTIRSPEGTRIRFKFIDFGNKKSRHRRSTDNVNKDFYFWFYDGLTDEANKFLTIYPPQDVNISKISEDNVLSFKMHVNARKISYAGFHMLYVAVPLSTDEKDRLYVEVRTDYNQTYRILVSESLVDKYRLNEYTRPDISNDIFKQMQDEENIFPEFLGNDVPVNLTGVVANIRVNYTWTYKIRASPVVLQTYGFKFGATINDVSLPIFLELKEVVNFVQLIGIREPTTLSGEIISIRVDLARIYKVHISASLIKKYDFMLHRTNDVGNSVFQQIRAQSFAAILIQLQSPVYPSGIIVTLRANFSLSYDATVSQTVKKKYHFLVNYTNDLSYALFNTIRNEANFVQLVKFGTPVQVSGMHLNIRVDYELIYDVVLQAQTVQEYNFLINQTNDVSNSVFNKIRIISPSIQLDYYKPAVPSQGMISIRVDRKLIYRISVPDNIKQQYFLATSGINDITQNMFERLRPSIVSLQLYRLEKPGTIGGIRTTIRVNFKGMYHVYLPRPILEKYYLSAQTTNDVSYSLFLTIQSQSNASQLYQIQTNVSLVGTPLSIRVDRHRVYQVYLSDSAIKRFDLLIHGVNDVTTSILQDILKTTRFYQLENVVVLPPPSGVQIMIRVNFSLIYKAYVPQHIKFKYHFLVEGFNDISLSSFSTLRHQFSYVELTTITTPVVPGVIPVRVLVNNKQTYDLYLPRQIRDKYNLKVNVTNDISTNVFIQLRSHSTYAQLRRVDVQEPTPKNVFIVRVGQRTYRVAFSDAEKDKFPLKLGTVNDVTVAMFAKISKDATSIQLAKVDSTVTVKVRVGLKWVYELTLSNRLRQEYNLKVNVTNDVTRSIFTTLQTESSSYKFISEVPADLKNTNTVSIRVGNTWQYNASLSQAAIRKYNLSANATNEISMKTFLRMRDDAVALQLEDVEPDNEFAQCPFGSWTKWFNRDDPSGPCDCETLPELRSENPGMICRYPTALQARLENCKTPFDLTQPNIDADTELGFRCKNENGQECMDYEVRFCCPET